MRVLLLALIFTMTASPGAAQDALPYYPDDVHTTAVDGRTIAYVDTDPTASERPVMVLVHGLGSNLSLWRDHIDAFAETHRVLALDLPGFGMSDKDDVPATMDFFAETVAEFLDARGVDRVVYVGVSMGGQIGLTFALAHPDRVERMVLVSPAGIETFTEQEAQQLTAMTTPEAIAGATDAQVRQSVALNFATWSEDHAWLVEQRHAIAAHDDFPGYAEANARAVAGMLNGPVRDRLDAVDGPVLVLFGAGDKLIPNRYLHPDQTPQTMADVARDALPNATVRLVDDAGHLLMVERPDAFREHVRTFLDSTATP